MANLPNPKSYNQILGEMLASYTARIGVNDLQTGSVVTSLFEAVAQSVYRSSGDIFQIIRDFSVDRAEGEALKRIAIEERVKIVPAQVATGTITITDSSFQKISTKVYAGDTAPNIGSTIIKVSDASKFPTSGQIYIGRGTPNIEGPISYSSIVPVGSFFQINLSTPTTKFHNISESVILSQGGVRNIPIATAVKTIGTGGSQDITFSTTKSVIILDGENQITGVPVAAQTPGADGNVPRNSIKKFISPPFTNAIVSNPSPFTTGRDEESDDELRAKIKRARISRGLGTALSVKNATLGAVAKDENATVTSNEIFSAGTDTTVLYVDNGSGYEEKSNGVGLEYMVDSALGGESYFQLSTGGQQTSVAKAFIESVLDGPFQIFPNYRLSLLIGGQVSEHVFGENDFRAPGAATAYEISASVNANPDLLFFARTSNEGKKIVFFSKEEQNEYIQITTPVIGTDAAPLLFLPENRVDTLKLYKNKKPLQKDGVNAFIQTQNQNTWSSNIASGETLILKVDGTSFITYTFSDSDFQQEGTHTTVSKSNTIQSWANVINNKVIGATATVTGSRLNLTSNLGANSRAKIEIDPASSFVTNGIFSASGALSAQGRESDFSLSRNTAQVKLRQPLQKGDSLSAGTDFSKAFIQSTPILGGTLTLADRADLWFIIDNQESQRILHGAISDTIMDVTKQAPSAIRYTSNQPNAFSNIQEGDYVIIWSDELNPLNRIEARVSYVTGNYFEINITSSEYTSAVVESGVVLRDGIIFLRTQKAPQKISLPAGTYTVNQISDILSSSVNGVTCSVENDEILIISSDTQSSKGCVYLPTFNTQAKALNLNLNEKQVADNSLFAFFENINSQGYFPFGHEMVSSERYADLPNTQIADFYSYTNLSSTFRNTSFVNFLHPYGQVKDAQGFGESAQVTEYITNQVKIDEENVVRRLRVGDRFFISAPYIFAPQDKLVVTLDSDPVNKSFEIPLSRKAITNSSAPVSANMFRAYDSDSGPTAEFSDFFPNFNFKNFIAFFRAKVGINPKNNTVNEDSILFRSTLFGTFGERYRICYEYPTVGNAPISSLVTITDTVNISIFLKSGNPIANTIDSTTEWNVTVSANTPSAGIDEVTYTWSGVGTSPNLSGLSSGSYVTINGNGEFSKTNQGSFKVISSTATSFTVHRPNGLAVAENNVATLTVNTIFTYESSNTTAQEIVDYTNSELSGWISAEILNDNGTNGSGVIDTSTLEDSGFTSQYRQLQDGQRSILVSNVNALAPNAQFTLSRPLVIPSISTATANAYTFNNGEEMYLTPSSAKQVRDFISVLAVSGYTTLGGISLSANDTKIQLVSSILGASGSVQIAGGSANKLSAPIESSASIVGTKMLVAVSKSLIQQPTNSWFKFQAQNFQRKDIGISESTNLTIIPNSPVAGKSKIILDNKETQDIYFGNPRNHIRTEGRAFHIEKHGKLTNLSWDGMTGSNPFFIKNVNIRNTTGNISVVKNTLTGLTEYTVTAPRSFAEVERGNVLTVSEFDNTENNGTFTVVGISSDKLTVAVSSSSGVTETKSITTAGISVLSNLRQGDSLVISQPFATLNQGTFKVAFPYKNSIYFENDFSVDERVVVNQTPKSFGGNASTDYNVTVTSSKNMRIEWNGNGVSPDFSLIKVGDILTTTSPFSSNNIGNFMVKKVGSTFVEVVNVLASTQSAVLGNSSMVFEEPSIKVLPYDATIPFDKLSISSNNFGANNQDSFVISEVLDENTAIVNGILDSLPSTNLGANFQQVYVEEGIKFSAYKLLECYATNPSSPESGVMVFTQNDNFNKINDSAGIIITSESKLGLPESLVKGTDAYRYNTGLIAEVNKILYGDPRDNTTYPGVAAAGAEIFAQAPLFRRINVSIDVRVNTGIPFTRVTEQVRNNVSALINSSPIGQSIAISDIISVVNSINGVKAVAISFPDYSATNDVIPINPAEKPIVIDASQDIIVSKTGN